MNKTLLGSLKILEQYSPQYNLIDKSLGIVTAGDSNVFPGIQILHASVKNKINFLCYDIGFTDSQKTWAINNGLNIKTIDIPSIHKSINKWQTCLKPHFIEDSPFEYTLWVDSDCIVTGDLSLSELIEERKTFFVQYWIKQKFLKKNSNELYKKFPVNYAAANYVNAGVFGINKGTHYHILRDWKALIQRGIEKDLLKYITQGDEGALNWAIQKHYTDSLIIDDYRYNCFSIFNSQHQPDNFATYHQKPFIIEGCETLPQLVFRKMLKNKEPFVLHYSTCMNNKEKYWTRWL